DGLVFKPGDDRKEIGRHLNLWRGWGIDPKAGSWTLMKWHIREVLANGDPKTKEDILNWAAWAVQNPDKTAGVAVVGKGVKGCGRGVFFRAMKEWFGGHALHISSVEHLTGRFSGHLRDVVYLFADEAYWPGDKQAEGVLKRLVTEPTLTIEQKGIDSYEW